VRSSVNPSLSKTAAARASQTARAIVEKFHSAATKVLATPAMQQRLTQLAINPMPITPADMDKYVTAELSSNERLIRAAGIK
jgi:tripartite-type tricarboxylate transporter receptor subunit TctC